MRWFVLVLALGLGTQAVAAQDRVSSKSEFLSLIDGNSLKIRLYTLTLDVLPNGAITGSALGTKITGSWTWNDGYFCRDMTWGTRDIGYNCQLVTAQPKKITFIITLITDRGAGDSATLRLVKR